MFQKRILTIHLSSIIQHKFFIKYKIPSYPIISYVIRDHLFDQALLDLEASVNLLQYFIYVQLGL